MENMRDLLVVKLGGSAITHKSSSPPKINPKVIANAAEDLRAHKGNVIVVLGGGAHGHQAAKKYGYGNQTTPRGILLEGIPEIRHNMDDLATQVEHVFVQKGIRPVVINPFSFVVMDNGMVDSFPMEIIRLALDANIVIITHGDVCFDRTRGASILSGDVIISQIVRELNASRVLLGTNVDGLFLQDPHNNPNAELIPLVTTANKEIMKKLAGESSDVDVTGGMALKVQQILEMTHPNREIILFNLLVPHRLLRILRGERVICTRFEK